MSKYKYAIGNNDRIIGLLWENEKLGNVLVTTGEKIDINCDLQIFNTSGEKIQNIDLKDFLLEVLPQD